MAIERIEHDAFRDLYPDAMQASQRAFKPIVIERSKAA
jgi:hypothetical protein